jgi:hypothetical protein
LRGLFLDSFEAESKRSWFTLRETLRATTKGGKIWTPVVVAPSEDKIRISTSEGTVEFRPRRLRWTATDSFVIVGLDKDTKLKRSYLRFKSPSEASEAATIIKRSPSVLEEPLVPVEEFSVQVRYLVTGVYAMVQFYSFLFRLFLMGIFLAIFVNFGAFGLIFAIGIGIFYFGLFFFGLLVRDRRRVPGWLRLEGRSIAVRTTIDWTPVFPKTIEWKSPKVIVLRGHGTKHELTFPTGQDLTQAVTKIRTTYPQVQETLSENYKQDPL